MPEDIENSIDNLKQSLTDSTLVWNLETDEDSRKMVFKPTEEPQKLSASIVLNCSLEKAKEFISNAKLRVNRQDFELALDIEQG